ncbi:MAG: hypothetical protein QOD58_3768, partial [Mycobacterium sp.]|nr:hypothetical protein [Mycobacterium sp.]
APAYERDVALNWPHRYFPALAPAVRVPVRFTLGEHDKVFRSDPDALAEVAEMFTSAPAFVTDLHPDAGHNLSLGLSATGYHRKLFTFADECLAARSTDDSAGDSADEDVDREAG